MSRIGKKAIEIPKSVKVEINGDMVTSSGPLGKLTKKIPEGITLDLSESSIAVKLKDDNPSFEKYTGLTRTIIANAVVGVVNGFSKDLEIIGVGYKAEVKSKNLVLNLGYSHQVNFIIPEGIKVIVNKNTLLKVSGIDKELVGFVASRIRGLRKPEPYKGKGIKYSDEVIKRKVGKASGK
ncbi:50S ribosomal protein L6 [Candidatus Acidulodesulfobacterium sp. H_13]|uniref:50S ribosomal protein L6 n=1 Tax=Candidatus Acidulodesulfobacterium sp. H_13 TaxID=3395470 RepID=UPI003AF9708E